MRRIQVQLTEEQERRLRQMAELRKCSISALIRDGIDAIVGQSDHEAQQRRERMLEVVGIGESGFTDVAERHDDHLP